MSVVLLRCPNCGTTQGAAGECEACHEADVRWFCPNHTPGRWLDGPACPECGATADRDRPAPSRASPPPPVSPRYRRETPRGPLDRPSREAPSPPPRPERREPEPPRRREPPRPPREMPPYETPYETPYAPPYTPPRASPGASDWAAPAPPARRPEPPPPAPRWERPPRAAGVSLVGCLGRLLATAVVLLVLLALAFFWFFGTGSVTSSVVDFGRQVGVVAGTPDQTVRGVEAFRAGDYARAERELREAAQAYPRSGVALVYLARIQRTRGDDVRALEYLEEALRREPDLAIAHRELAGVHLGRARRLDAEGAGDDVVTGDLTTAERHFARALELAPTDRPTRVDHACALEALGRAEEAAAELAAAGVSTSVSCARGERGTVRRY